MDETVRADRECGHTEAGLEDLEVHMIDKNYLKETRKKKGTRVGKCGRTLPKV